jgi:hypothetical protein
MDDQKTIGDHAQAPEPTTAPQSYGVVTPEQEQKALQWITQHWGAAGCPFHGPTNWQIDNHLAQVPVYSARSFLVGGPVYPLIVVTCAICGFTVFVNALRAGVLLPDATAGSPEPD